ncbi:MAG TPA: hypothetical protein VL463_03140 [Kofleriaceae bacterium]|nr:hypothetical protein [Kofleriaceae bacterium]
MRTFFLLPALAASACAADGTTSSQVTCGEPRYFQIDKVHVAADTGLDLNKDGNPDNALGALIGAVRLANPDIGDLDAKVNARLATDTPWFLIVSDCDDGQHVEIGDAGGEDTVPLSILVDERGDFAPVAWVRPVRVKSELSFAPDEAGGKLAFILRSADVAHALLAPTAIWFSKELAAGSSPLAATLDLDKDGVVTVDELLQSDWIHTLTRPDLTLDASGVPIGMSGGVYIHATRVSL